MERDPRHVLGDPARRVNANGLMTPWQFITELEAPHVINGRNYRVSIEGTERDDGTWAGRVAFRDGAETRRTEQETSQPNRGALEYWASGLEQVYLEGAFSRSS